VVAEHAQHRQRDADCSTNRFAVVVSAWSSFMNLIGAPNAPAGHGSASALWMDTVDRRNTMRGIRRTNAAPSLARIRSSDRNTDDPAYACPQALAEAPGTLPWLVGVAIGASLAGQHGRSRPSGSTASD
jgi:hypothetical protein